MIIRVWTAHAKPEGAPRCQARVIEKTQELKSREGYRGATLLRRPDGDKVELVLCTRWQSLDAIREFAGADIERAEVDEDEAATMLTRWDTRVRHYEVVHEDEA